MNLKDKINKYKHFLRENVKQSAGKRVHGTKVRKLEVRLQLLDFFEKNNRWPDTTDDKRLLWRFKHAISRWSPIYDYRFRRLVIASGRKIKNNPSPKPQKNKEKILNFIRKNNRTPKVKSGWSKNNKTAENKLGDLLFSYNSDKEFLKEVYSLDKCYRSGIPHKFRPIINSQITVEKPLVEFFNYELKVEKEKSKT